MSDLTQRQKNEIEYHQQNLENLLKKKWLLDEAVLRPHARRWWNAYWQMYTFLLNMDLQGKKILVPGCGLGQDTLKLAKLKGEVYGFDISPEIIAAAKNIAQQQNCTMDLQIMPAEHLTYPDNYFDIVLIVDILHHVDIPLALREIQRVCKPDAIILMNEVYSHSWTERVRNAKWVTQRLYPWLQRTIYQSAFAYITKDERKLHEKDIQEIQSIFSKITSKEYYYFIIKRLIPDNWHIINMIDRVLLILLHPIAYLLAGRILMLGKVKK